MSLNYNRKSLLYSMLLVIFLFVIFFFYYSLQKQDQNSIRVIAPISVGKQLPAIEYADTVYDGTDFNGYATSDLQLNEISVLNIWASWCTPCRAEHEILMKIKDLDIPLYGINYRDKLENAVKFLDDLGNPFTGIGFDFDGVLEGPWPMLDLCREWILNYSRPPHRVLTIDWQHSPTHGFPFMNMGLMLMNKSFAKYLNGQTPKEFINRHEFKMFVDGMGPWKWSTDQTLLNYWIRNENMNIKQMDWKWNGLYTACSRIMQCHFVHFFLKDKLPDRGENVKFLKKEIL